MGNQVYTNNSVAYLHYPQLYRVPGGMSTVYSSRINRLSRARTLISSSYATIRILHYKSEVSNFRVPEKKAQYYND